MWKQLSWPVMANGPMIWADCVASFKDVSGVGVVLFQPVIVGSWIQINNMTSRIVHYLTQCNVMTLFIRVRIEAGNGRHIVRCPRCQSVSPCCPPPSFRAASSPNPIGHARHRGCQDWLLEACLHGNSGDGAESNQTASIRLGVL